MKNLVRIGKMLWVWFEARKHIRGRDKELWRSIKTIYPVVMQCNVTIKEMIALLILVKNNDKR